MGSANENELSINTQRSKIGEQSLQWDWTSGSKLMFDRAIGLEGDVPVQENDRTKSLLFWIYNDQAQTKSITVRFGEKSNVQDKSGYFEFDVNIDFKGWRAVLTHIQWDKVEWKGTKAKPVEKDFYGNPISPMQKVGKLIVPTAEEITINSRARSAKLRIAEKI